MSTWSSVFKSKLEHQAQIVRDVLLNHEVPAVVVNKTDSSYRVLDGPHEVRVPADKVLTALKIIENDITFE
jgi:hypothetical protein